jgi:hypothetical protein
LRARYYQSKLRTGSEVVAADTRRTAANTPDGDFNRGEHKLAAPLSAGSNSSE